MNSPVLDLSPGSRCLYQILGQVLKRVARPEGGETDALFCQTETFCFSPVTFLIRTPGRHVQNEPMETEKGWHLQEDSNGINLQLNSEIVFVVLYGFFNDNTEIPAAQETPCSSRDKSCLEHKVLLKGSGHAEEEEKKTRSFCILFWHWNGSWLHHLLLLFIWWPLSPSM